MELDCVSEVATEYEECLPSCEGVFITQVQTGSVGNSEKLQGLMSKGRVQKFLLNRLVDFLSGWVGYRWSTKENDDM